jgi:hypothetical protein
MSYWVPAISLSSKAHLAVHAYLSAPECDCGDVFVRKFRRQQAFGDVSRIEGWHHLKRASSAGISLLGWCEAPDSF